MQSRDEIDLSPAEVCCFVPVKARSTRVPSKNVRRVGGRTLYERCFETLLEAGFRDIRVDTDLEEVASAAAKLGISVIQRDPALATDSANGNDLLMAHCALTEARIVVQAFVTAPFLKAETARRVVAAVQSSSEVDSAFTVAERGVWFWFDERPVNYDPAELPRSQDARRVLEETTAIYAIRREVAVRERCRIGRAPQFVVVDDVEAVDLDTEEDFVFASFLIDSGVVS